MVPKNGPASHDDKPIEEQVREQTGQRHVRLAFDERDVRTSYANAFRTNGSAEEVVVDFGLNQARPAASPQGQGEILVQINQRVILNYYSAKRLALALAQIVQRHEEQFGDLELDVAKRSRRPLGS
ncbi:MAG TPA: DUF3467 domain-containing protein [Phycisphaerae bacterium]|nr:DUF3467 domain-containing protein [Phycisphaerae bacterium]HOI56149.1 DUF3467 domain-containing protein [Phycisphaerae bacterium]